MRSAAAAAALLAAGSARALEIGDRVVRAFTVYDSQPLSAAAAGAAGWKQTGACDPARGVPHMYGGVPSKKTPTTLYFSGSGQMAGVGVDVYGYNIPSLVKAGYFDNVGGGRFHISVTFRGGDVCQNTTYAEKIGDRLVVNAHSIAQRIPLTEADAVAAKYARGSFFKDMGWHYALDLKTAPHMSFRDDALMPVIPMYTDGTGEFRAFLIAATPQQECLMIGTNATSNQWEPAALNPFNMCKNFCQGESKNVLGGKALFPSGPCQWDETYSTMHFFLRDHAEITVPSRLHCFLPGIGCCEQ